LGWRRLSNRPRRQGVIDITADLDQPSARQSAAMASRLDEESLLNADNTAP